jgi:hypothetical protein
MTTYDKCLVLQCQSLAGKPLSKVTVRSELGQEVFLDVTLDEALADLKREGWEIERRGAVTIEWVGQDEHNVLHQCRLQRATR